MTRLTSLHILQPCAESWDAMTPTPAGRHCVACQKKVVDFTLKTDAEILAYLAKAAGGRTCGRFAAGQLERPLQRATPAAPTARWRAWLAAVVAVWGVREGVSTEAKAQAPVEMQRKIGKTVLSDELRMARRPGYEGSAGPVVIRGVVLDSATHYGLPGVTVLVQNSSVGISTDKDGTFELTIPAQHINAGMVELQINYIGYVSEKRSIPADSARPLQIQLRTDVKGLLGELIIVPLKMPPAPWHPRQFYYWGKYWLTRPFRRS